jgi:hypothetical protein
MSPQAHPSATHVYIRVSKNASAEFSATVAKKQQSAHKIGYPSALPLYLFGSKLKPLYAERLIQSPHRAFGCFSLLILNDRAAPSYQLLDLSLAGLPPDRLFLIANLLSFEVGVLVLSLLDTCLPPY